MKKTWRTAARRSFVFAVVLLSCGLTGCATWPKPTSSVHTGVSSPVGECADFFARLDHRTVTDDAVDSGAARIESYPYLRANRFLSSFANNVQEDSSFYAWIEKMQQLDQQARHFEIANLSDASVANLHDTGNRKDLPRRVVHCGNLLKSHDFSQPSARRHLSRRVEVPDEYLAGRRVLGLYPLTRLFVSRGVHSWHREERMHFSTLPPVDWQSIRFLPDGKREVSAAAAVVLKVQRDALGIPLYSANERELLFRTHAPIWEVQFRSDADRIGRPYWALPGQVRVDLDRPETFTHLNFTRFGDSVLTQLNYVIWFPSRPKRNLLDIYAGDLDGINYRVTLDASGEPILHETVHNCGCYYKAYPVDRLQRRGSIDYTEEPLILEAPKGMDAATRVVVAMEGGSHFVRHLYPNEINTKPKDTVYTTVAYAELRSLEQADGKRRSLFNRYGVVAGSERLERFLFWPMGVYSTGSMRQWGRHAVAFAGRRHFDDPFYLEKMFVLNSAAPPWSVYLWEAYFLQQTAPVAYSQAAQAGEPSSGIVRRSSARYGSRR